MIYFPNAKINLGLRVLGRRADGYHDVSTVMYPIGWSDILEIIPSPRGSQSRVELYLSGRPVACPKEKNLVMKAVRAVEIETERAIRGVDIYLNKVVPDGAGLGAGSSDAAFTVRGLNEVLDLGMTRRAMERASARVGADCPFFIADQPALATGTGTDLQLLEDFTLSGYTLLVAKPCCEAVSTAEAYAGITPCGYDVTSPSHGIKSEVGQWETEGIIVNDFEKSVFPKRMQIAILKETLKACGAEYAAMTGSGAAVFGLFSDYGQADETREILTGCDTYIENL